MPAIYNYTVTEDALHEMHRSSERRIYNICAAARHAGWLATTDTFHRGYRVQFKSPGGSYFTGPVEMDLRVALAKACEVIEGQL